MNTGYIDKIQLVSEFGRKLESMYQAVLGEWSSVLYETEAEAQEHLDGVLGIRVRLFGSIGLGYVSYPGVGGAKARYSFQLDRYMGRWHETETEAWAELKLLQEALKL